MYPVRSVGVGVVGGSGSGGGGSGVLVSTGGGGAAAQVTTVPWFGIEGGGVEEENGTSSMETTEEANCRWFTFILYVVVFGALCIFGLIGNSLSFAVLRWERHSHVATFLLQVMACADNLFLLTTGFAQIVLALTIFLNDNSNPLTAYLTVCVWPLVHVTMMWTVWITVLIAVNRYVAICRPFQAPLWCTMTQARRQVVILGAIIVFYNLPRFFEYRLEYSKDGLLEANPTEIKESRLYNILYENVLYCLFVFLGPLVILVVLNACLIHELVMSRQRLRAIQLPGQGSSGDDQEHNLTLVMIVIILLFVVCQTPAFLNQLLYYALSEDGGYSCGRVYFYYFHVSNLVVSANSSVNFIIYCVFRRQFRQRVAAFCGRSRRLIDKHPDNMLLNTARFNKTTGVPSTHSAQPLDSAAKALTLLPKNNQSLNCHQTLP